MATSVRTGEIVRGWLRDSEEAFDLQVHTVAGKTLQGAVLRAEADGLLLKPNPTANVFVEWECVDYVARIG